MNGKVPMNRNKLYKNTTMNNLFEWYDFHKYLCKRSDDKHMNFLKFTELFMNTDTFIALQDEALKISQVGKNKDNTEWRKQDESYIN
jgi:hypothetical protein